MLSKKRDMGTAALNVLERVEKRLAQKKDNKEITSYG